MRLPWWAFCISLELDKEIDMGNMDKKAAFVNSLRAFMAADRRDYMSKQAAGNKPNDLKRSLNAPVYNTHRVVPVTPTAVPNDNLAPRTGDISPDVNNIVARMNRESAAKEQAGRAAQKRHAQRVGSIADKVDKATSAGLKPYENVADIYKNLSRFGVNKLKDGMRGIGKGLKETPAGNSLENGLKH